MIYKCWVVVVAAFMAIATTTAHAEDTEILEFGKRIQQQIESHDFAALDAEFAKDRDGTATFAGGMPRIHLFFWVLNRRSVEGNIWKLWSSVDAAEPDIAKRIEDVNVWKQTNPSSQAARLALTRLWLNYAWQGRGTKYSSQTTQEQWKLFRDRMQKTQDELSQVELNNPEALFIAIWFARNASVTRPVIDRLCDRALKEFPRFLPFYLLRADLLEAKWYGNPGESERYPQSLLANPGGDVGVQAYSVIATGKIGSVYMSEFFQKSGLNWEAVRAGYEARRNAYGLSIDDWNTLLFFAAGALDRPAASLAADNIGDNWARWVWKEQRYFDPTAAWARHG